MQLDNIKGWLDFMLSTEVSYGPWAKTGPYDEFAKCKYWANKGC